MAKIATNRESAKAAITSVEREETSISARDLSEGSRGWRPRGRRKNREGRNSKLARELGPYIRQKLGSGTKTRANWETQGQKAWRDRELHGRPATPLIDHGCREIKVRGAHCREIWRRPVAHGRGYRGKHASKVSRLTYRLISMSGVLELRIPRKFSPLAGQSR